MPETKGAILRFVAKLRAVFDDDWTASAGTRWRDTVSRISLFNDKFLQLDEKAREAPDLAWTAAKGLASEKHAKATSDYAKAENDRIDAALKRRVSEDKARQERATANKLEAEAAQARIQEIKARIALDRELKELGVALVLSKDGTIIQCRYADQMSGRGQLLLNSEGSHLLQSALVDVVIPTFGDLGVVRGKLTRWLRARGDRVVLDEPILELETTLVDTGIPSPATGTLFELLVAEGTEVEINKTVVARIDPVNNNPTG